MTSHRTPRSIGQTLPLFAILLPGMLALMALGLDSAQLFLERRDAQGAADLAALAGVKYLDEVGGVTTTEQANARSAAIANGIANGYAASQVVPRTPVDGDATRIEVSIQSSVDMFFLPALDPIVPGDHSFMDVGARAVADSSRAAGSGGDFAVFALESCPSTQKTVDISGSTIDFIGRVHSNSDIYIAGSSNDFIGGTTHTCPSTSFQNGGGGNTFGPAPTKAPLAPAPEPDPVALARSDFTCTFTAPGSGMWDLSSNGIWWVGGSKSSKTLKPGTYCSRSGSSDGIKLGDSDIVVEGQGGVTFVGQAYIEISGSNFRLRPHEREVLFVSYGTSDVAIKLSGSGGTWEGIVYAPRGTAEVSGSSNLGISGGIVATRVKLNGSSYSINGTAGQGAPGEQTIALKE
jgi:hypothetical protein